MFCCLYDGDNDDNDDNGDRDTNYDTHLPNWDSQRARQRRARVMTYLHIFPPLGQSELCG
jgi:hypothetical protein